MLVFAKTGQHPILTYEEYAQKQFSRPYTFALSNAQQHLFYFGANHSCNPNNPQYPCLERFFQAFLEQTKDKKRIILIEGNERRLQRNTMEAISYSGGEGGLMTFLAHQHGIELLCPEPTQKELESMLLNDFSEDEIAYRIFAQNVQQFHRGKSLNQSRLFDDFYVQRGYGNQAMLARMKDMHYRLFNAEFNPDDEAFFDRITDPVLTDTRINTVCRQASIIRDQWIVTRLEALMLDGYSLFITFGWTHAVMQEPAIRKVWEKIESRTFTNNAL